MRHAKVIPMKGGIIELRQKGASLRLIRYLFASAGVAVRIDMIASLLAPVTTIQRHSITSAIRRARTSRLRTQPQCNLPLFRQ
jgi:hypothetical protein